MGVLVLSKNRNREDRNEGLQNCRVVLERVFFRYWTLNADAGGNIISGNVQPKNSPNCKYDVALISGSWKLLRNRLLAS